MTAHDVATSTVERSTRSGSIRGVRHEGVDTFWGIPYAMTPTGTGSAKRLAPPRQRFGTLDARPLLGPGWREGDYLSTTVWAPSGRHTGAAACAPVLVFLHGGGLIAGASSAAALDGEALARRGLVVVSVQYRLGIAGWMHVDGAPANRGLLDQLLALRWVQENIDALGGDPGAVTLAGQSAGAICVAALMASEQGTGLFQRAISQSGSALAHLTVEQAARVSAAVAAHLDAPTTLAGLSTVPDAALARAAAVVIGTDLATSAARDPLLGITPFMPVSGTVSLPGPVPALIASRAGVPLLAGSTHDEANLYLVPTGADVDAARLAATATACGGDTDVLLPAYAERDGGPRQQLAALMTDATFWSGTNALVEANRGPSWRYEFAWRPDSYGGALGSCHCIELPLVFGTVSAPGLAGPENLLGTTPRAPRWWRLCRRRGRRSSPAATRAGESTAPTTGE